MGKLIVLSIVSAMLALPQPRQSQRPLPAGAAVDSRRDAWQKPNEVVHALGIGKSEVIADIGAGRGYFARRFTAQAEKVYAVDIDPEVLKIAAQGAAANLETVLAAAGDPRLPANAIDTVFFCNAFHHLENRSDYLKRLIRVLRPGGRIVIIDFHKKALPVGPPAAMKLSEQEVITEMQEAGFTKTRSFDFLPYQYFLVFNR